MLTDEERCIVNDAHISSSGYYVRDLIAIIDRITKAQAVAPVVDREQIAGIAAQLSTAIGYFSAKANAASKPNAASDAILKEAHKNIAILALWEKK